MTERVEPWSRAVTLGGGRMADEKHCFSCGRLLHHTSLSCPSCGAVQPGAVQVAAPLAPGADHISRRVFCYGCGTPIHAAAFACPKCGAPQAAARPLASSKSRVVAAVLAFLLGGIGAHKFYLGRIGWGIAYLLFCWTFIPSIIALIDGFVLLAKSDAEFARDYP
jgi:TM2 domain-containing membrane protein YozV/predicted RNA-binding Zn-ribbon protein involved in translation (DUF1610 family)